MVSIFVIQKEMKHLKEHLGIGWFYGLQQHLFVWKENHALTTLSFQKKQNVNLVDLPFLPSLTESPRPFFEEIHVHYRYTV